MVPSPQKNLQLLQPLQRDRQGIHSPSPRQRHSSSPSQCTLESLRASSAQQWRPSTARGLPPMPKQATSAEGPQAEQMQRSLAPHTMLVTPLAPAARRLSAVWAAQPAGQHTTTG